MRFNLYPYQMTISGIKNLIQTSRISLWLKRIDNHEIPWEQEMALHIKKTVLVHQYDQPIFLVC